MLVYRTTVLFITTSRFRFAFGLDDVDRSDKIKHDEGVVMLGDQFQRSQSGGDAKCNHGDHGNVLALSCRPPTVSILTQSHV